MEERKTFYQLGRQLAEGKGEDFEPKWMGPLVLFGRYYQKLRVEGEEPKSTLNAVSDFIRGINDEKTGKELVRPSLIKMEVCAEDLGHILFKPNGREFTGALDAILKMHIYPTVDEYHRLSGLCEDYAEPYLIEIIFVDNEKSNFKGTLRELIDKVRRRQYDDEQ